MGRRIRMSDDEGDVGLLLRHCLSLVDSGGLKMTAVCIATALDKYNMERDRTGQIGNGRADASGSSDGQIGQTSIA